MYRLVFILLVTLQFATSTVATEREEPIAFGDMDSWLTREIKESRIIGGDIKTLYEIAPPENIVGDEAYENRGGSPWATSNVLAKVKGVTKTNCSVFPEQRDSGYVANLKTRIEEVKVLRFLNISVIAAGSVFLGSVVEPIKGVSNPQGVINSGIPFSKRPRALRFDYSIELSGEENRLRMTGMSAKKTIEGMDMPTTVLLLQKRWEDEKGILHAARIGTIIVNYRKNQDWVKDATYEIIYGDATTHDSFTPEMGLGYEQRYALNSKGENVELIEDSWAEADEEPTHIILQFASSHGGAYIGSPGNQMWVDNVRLVY